MEEWQKRVIEEFEQLDDRMKKLRAFLDTQQYLNLSMGDRILLMNQAAAMAQYRDILNSRIEKFNTTGGLSKRAHAEFTAQTLLRDLNGRAGYDIDGLDDDIVHSIISDWTGIIFNANK